MYAYVRTDNMSGTDVAKDLASAKFYDGSAEAEIENGHFVTLGAFITGEREVRKATAPTATTALKDLWLVATPEVVKNKTHYGLGEFINEAGELIRCYRLTTGSYFSVSANALDGTATVGSFVLAQAGTKGKIASSEDSNTTTIGKVVEIADGYVAIEVA